HARGRRGRGGRAARTAVAQIRDRGPADGVRLVVVVVEVDCVRAGGGLRVGERLGLRYVALDGLGDEFHLVRHGGRVGGGRAGDRRRCSRERRATVEAHI